jgi:hypothetical protein
MMSSGRLVEARPNTWLQPTVEDLLASLAPSVPSLRSAAAEPQR